MLAIVAAGIGFVVGAFTPSVGRRIKAFFVKESSALKADAKSAATAAEKKL